MPRDKRDRWGRLLDRWGRLLVHRDRYAGRDSWRRSELTLRVDMFPAREFTQRRLGAAQLAERYTQPSAVMDLGEAVRTALDRGLPLRSSCRAQCRRPRWRRRR